MYILVGGTLAVAAVVASLMNLYWLHLIPYLIAAASLVTLQVVLVAVFVQVCKMASARHPDPLSQLRSDWLRRDLLPRLLLPALAVPLFMAAFVTLKAAATMAIPYDWDALLTELDYVLFGVDPWVPLHLLLNHSVLPDILEFTYVGWQLLLPATLACVAIWMKPRNAAVFYSAMFMTWVVAGIFVAAGMHSAGPIFAYIFNDSLGARFEPLGNSLMEALSWDSRILRVHTLLALGVGDELVSRGGGISAMPSVHVAVTGVFVCAAWGHSVWRPAALIFAAVIWIGSVYFGYHYVTDGPVGFGIAIGCWAASGRIVALLQDFGQTSSRILSPVSLVAEPIAQGSEADILSAPLEARGGR